MNTTWLSATWADLVLSSCPVFSRVLGLIVGTPFLGDRRGPIQVRIGLALLITLLCAPLAEGPVALTILQRAVLCGGELLVGLAMGFVVRMTFAAVQVAGQLIEVPMGMGMSEVMDLSGVGRVPIFGQFYTCVVAQVFFAADGHLAVLRALGESFVLVPVGTSIVSAGVGESVFRTFADMVVSGVRVATPILVAVFVTDIALAVANRVVPQLNIFSVGFPLKTAIGLVAAMAALPFFIQFALNICAPQGAILLHLSRLIQGLH